MQLDAADECGAKLPAEHAMQDVEADAAGTWDDLPAGQPTQLEDMPDSEYEPAWHELQESAPAPEYVPAEQLKQLLDPGTF